MSFCDRAVPGVVLSAVFGVMACAPGDRATTDMSASTAKPSADAGADAGAVDTRWWAPGDKRRFPRSLSYENELGVVTTLLLEGPLETQGHPFFSPLGRNGRACVSCHQPADGMSLSVASIQERWQLTDGKDPIFAATDGSNCPSLPQARSATHSLLLERGLFRIARPWPPRTADGAQLEPEFSIEVVKDPTGCNTDARYGLHSANPMLSVYRRPRPATNLKYVTAVGFVFDPKDGLPLPTDPETGAYVSGNLMSDDRATTLEMQARDALRVHLELPGSPDSRQLSRIVAFEQQLYTALSSSRLAGSLSEAGAQGGPELLSTAVAGVLQSSSAPIWSEFAAWKEPPGTPASSSQQARRASIARGAELFSTRTFLVSDAAGVNDLGFGNPVRNSCAFCHNMQRVGLDVAPGRVDIGTSNEPFASNAEENPVLDLPLFKLTCRDGARPHAHLGPVVYTHDPGYALTTGKCIDIGKITAQQMRGLSARPPYFSQGNAKTLRDVVEFYDKRFEIELTDQEKEDLTNFLEVL